MLVKLTKYQVSYYWPLIKHLLDTVDLPLARGDKNKRDKVVLRRLLIEEMICWAMVVQDTENEMIYLQGIVITSEVSHEMGYDYLYIDFYAKLPDAQMRGRDAIEMFDTLKRYATSRGCDAILAHSRVSEVINLTKRLGADTEFRVLMWDLK